MVAHNHILCYIIQRETAQGEQMKKEHKKLIKVIIIAFSVFVAICLIEFICIYAIKGDETREFYKEFWRWYIEFVLFQIRL